MSKKQIETIFEQAARVFEGWNDPETKLRVLKVAVKGRDISPRVDVEALRHGWNERILFTYPDWDPQRAAPSMNRHPHMLPDCSGVLVTAGYRGPKEGVYMVEWPKDLK